MSSNYVAVSATLEDHIPVNMRWSSHDASQTILLCQFIKNELDLVRPSVRPSVCPPLLAL